MPTDEELYREWTRGDRNAGGALVDRYLERIGRFFANKVSDPGDTEDLVGETFEVCARVLGSFREQSRFRTYLYGIAKNVLRDYIRRRTRDRQVDELNVSVADLGPSPSSLFAARKEHELLLRALRTLPLAYQLVIELSLFEEMSRSEIAEALEIPPGTVGSRLRKGRALLRDQLETLADDPEALEKSRGQLRTWERSLDSDPGD